MSAIVVNELVVEPVSRRLINVQVATDDHGALQWASWLPVLFDGYRWLRATPASKMPAKTYTVAWSFPPRLARVPP